MCLRIKISWDFEEKEMTPRLSLGSKSGAAAGPGGPGRQESAWAPADITDAAAAFLDRSVLETQRVWGSVTPHRYDSQGLAAE